MTLTLTPTHRIHDLDQHNIVLQRLHRRTSGKDAGKDVWLTIGYHTTLESALLHAQDTLAHDRAPSDLQEALSAIKAANKDILEAVAYRL